MIKIFIATNKPLDLYRCVLSNHFISKYPITISANDNERGLPERNNEFIENHLLTGAYCWLVFMHDDVAFLQDLSVIESLPKNMIYGLCGVKKTNGKGEIVGQIKQPHPSEENKFVLLGRKVDGFEKVDTFDSLCTIVHSSLLETHSWLRFDESLKYHMHVEELSIRAKRIFDVSSAVVQMDVIHMSWGEQSPEYHKAVEYVNKTHNLEAFISTCNKRSLDHYGDDEGWKCLK